MTLLFRICLFIGVVFITAYILKKTRKAAIQVTDVIFWAVLAALLLVLAVFPQITFWVSDLLGIQSPANLVFLCAIGLLLFKLFVLNMEVSTLKNRINALSQEIALHENELRKELDNLSK